MEWGPVFWRLLHAMAERAGSAPMPGLRADEVRAWKSMLTTLGKTLPCEDCRDHYTQYLTANPVNIPDNYAEVKEYIRKWLYDVHSDINVRLGKCVFDYALLTPTYSVVPIRKTYDVLNILIKRSIQGAALPIMSWTNWSKNVKTLYGMYT
jgi:hypothetical protein